MKRFKLKTYGRAKTNALRLCPSVEEGIFMDCSQEIQEAAPRSNTLQKAASRSNRFSDSETSNELFTSLIENKSFVKKMKHKKPTKKSKCKKRIEQLSKSNLSSSTNPKYKKKNRRIVCQAHPRKCNRKKQCVEIPSIKPRFSSFSRYTLNVEKRKRTNNSNIFASNDQTSLNRTLQVSLSKLDKSLHASLAKLNKRVRAILPRSSNTNPTEINISTLIPSTFNDADHKNVQTQISLLELYGRQNRLGCLTSTPVPRIRKKEIITPLDVSKISAVSTDYDSADIGITELLSVTEDSLEIRALPPPRSEIVTCRSHQVSCKVDKASVCHTSSRSLNETSAKITQNDTKIDYSLETLLQMSTNKAVIDFEAIYNWRLTSVRKIGEGSYGEVFMVTSKRKSSVIKVIPFSKNNINPELQTIESVYSEIKVSLCLSSLRTSENNNTKNFNKLKSTKIVKGPFPSKLLQAWDESNKIKPSYNNRPVYNEEQHYAILEQEYGGKDLESFVMRSAVEGEAILKQICVSLAIAEEAHLFEHRDLHLGNVLVKRNKSKRISYILNGRPFYISSEGLIVSIIDFTLSRILDDGVIYYNDLANDEIIFNQTGDFQFAVYKLTKIGLRNMWKESLLFSNVLWINYLCRKFAEWPHYSRPVGSKHVKSIETIKNMLKSIMDCESALDVLQHYRIINFVPKHSQKSLHQSSIIKYFDRKSNSCVKI